MIKVENLNFTYPGNQSPTINDVCFEIARGEIFGLLGPSGAGKSTTQKILFGLLKDYTGKVSVMDKEIQDWDSGLYEKIGISFELPNHYLNLTAEENLEYFGSLYAGDKLDILEVLEWVGLKDAAAMRVSNFSKGMKVRLNVARSLLHKPEILFLDEPTSGLDPVNARIMKDLILNLREKGATVFVTTHNMMVADELCDRVAFITDGSIRAVDSPEKLKKQYGKRTVVVGYTQGDQAKEDEFPIEGLGKNADFLNLLNAAGSIETIHSQETTLEDIFIKITGKELV